MQVIDSRGWTGGPHLVSFRVYFPKLFWFYFGPSIVWQGYSVELGFVRRRVSELREGDIVWRFWFSKPLWRDSILYG